MVAPQGSGRAHSGRAPSNLQLQQLPIAHANLPGFARGVKAGPSTSHHVSQWNMMLRSGWQCLKCLAAWLNRLRKNTEKQIPRRLKPPRNDKSEVHIGTSKLVPFPKHVLTEFFRSLW